MCKEIWTMTFLFWVGLTYGQSQQGNLLGRWEAENIPSSSQYNNTYNEVWGLAINGVEYAILGSTEGTHFINVTDPTNPIEEFFVKGASYGPHIIHRDFHDYKGYLYIVADEDIGTLKSTMQIVDISNLPESIEVVYDNDDRIRKAHNIFIDTAEAKLYGFAVKGGDDPYAPLRIYDIQDPLKPKQLGEYRFGIDGLTVGHFHDGFVKNNIAYLNAGFDGLVIADLSNPESPELLSHLEGTDYPDSGYNHSGWLSEDGKYYFLGDETWGTDIKVFDVSDPRNVQYISKFDAGNPSIYSMTHNQIVHCGYLFTSYYYDGLQVFDISDPTSPERVIHYPTSQLLPRQSYEGAWGVYPFLPSGNILVSDMQNGLFIIANIDTNCGNYSSTNEKTSKKSISIGPNPTFGRIQLKSESPIKSIEVFGLDGRMHSAFSISDRTETQINLEHLMTGVYIMKIGTNEGQHSEKIIIQP